MKVPRSECCTAEQEIAIKGGGEKGKKKDMKSYPCSKMNPM
jgi:hypothetical protein